MRTSSECGSTPSRASRFVASAALACAALAGCRATRPAEPPPGPAAGVTVVVSMYSGRPDPSFVLDDAAAIAELAESVREAPPATDFRGDSVLRSILGYRGVLVRNPSGAGGLPESLIVFDGHVEVGGEPPRFLRDQGREIEQRLIDLAVAAEAITAGELRLIRGR